jgi:hypothetical protein
MPSTLQGVDRQLTWTDFPRKNEAAPPAGVVRVAAETFSGINFNRPGTQTSPGSVNPFFFPDSFTVTAQFQGPKSWVKSWVFGLNQAEQDDLLKHEQGHYSITALVARDFFEDLMVVQATFFPSAAAALSEFNRVKASSFDKVQTIQNLYDQETNHGQNADPQAQWLRLIDWARTMPRRSYQPCQVASWYTDPDPWDQPPLGYDHTPLKRRLIEVLKEAGKNI